MNVITVNDFLIIKGISRHSNLRYHGRLPETVEEGWKITFAKWEILSTADGLVRDGAASTCGLCMIHEACIGCPVSEFGYRGCRNTPFDDYGDCVKYDYLEEAKIAASQELLFLQKIYRKSHSLPYRLRKAIKSFFAKLKSLKSKETFDDLPF